MDEIKRDRLNLFWSEWEAVTERTRHLLKRHTDHSIILTADPVLLRDSINHQQWKNRHKKAADCSNSHNRQKVESIAKFPPLIIPQ